jgi:YVTN family beta-propeller protein
LPSGKVAYVTVGGEDVVKVYSRAPGFAPVATIPVGANPHGIWSSGDASRVYVGLENGDSVVAINTATNRVLGKIKVGQAPMALMYVPNAVPSGVASTANLGQQLLDKPTLVHNLRSLTPGAAAGTMNLRSEGLVDLATFNLRALAPDTDYDIYLTNSAQAPYARNYALTSVHTDAKGNAMGQALGPVQRVAGGDLHPAGKAFTRVIVTLKAADGQPALVSE